MLSLATRLLAVAATFICVATFAPTAEAARRRTNVAPVISGTPATSVTAGSYYKFAPKATDANGDRLSYQIVGKPVWARFYTSSGSMSGTPTTAQVGTYANIVISVSDGKVSRSLPAFAITVKAPVVANQPPVVTNQPPVITGSPAVAAQSGQPYSFRPNATDLDGNPLTFTIQNQPAWATFDPSNGTLYGTPVDASVGTYASILISVSDGKAISSLPAFTITVALAPRRSATLSWKAPTSNVDGSPLQNLAGYKVYYGSSPGAYTQTLDLPVASMTSAVIEGFETGSTWYFAIKAVSAGGVASEYSNVVSKLF